MNKEFTIQVRVYYEDTDAGGIVYHANYLKFCERARSDFIRELGMSQPALLAEGKGFVVSKMQCRFICPVKFDELVTVSVQVQRVRHVGLTFAQKVRRSDGTVCFALTCEIAFVDFKAGALLPLPAETAAALQAYLPSEE